MLTWDNHRLAGEGLITTMSETIQDDVLGTLTHNAKWGVFNGVVPFDDNQVGISIIFASPADAVSPADLAQAREAYLALVSRKSSIEAAIVDDLLTLYNDTWREDRDPINQHQFLEAIKPDVISIELGFVRSLWYDDGDLFAGHALLIRFDEDSNITEIGLAG